MNKMLNDAELEAAVALKTEKDDAAERKARQEAECAEIEREQRADMTFYAYSCDCTPVNRFGYPVKF